MEDFTTYLLTNGYDENSTNSYVQTSKRFESWIADQDIEIATIRYNDMTAYVQFLKSRGVGQRTIQFYVAQLRAYFDYQKQNGLMSDNIIRAMKIQGIQKTGLYRIFTKEELNDLYSNFPSKEHTLFELPLTDTELRDRVLLSLFVYQGITTTDLKALRVEHLALRSGMIHIPQTKRINARSLKLEAHQAIDLQLYLSTARQTILNKRSQISEELIVGYYGGKNAIQNILSDFTAKIKEITPEIESLKHIRASVITNWLKGYNLRKVQYFAGHKFVSSTEKFLQNDTDSLLDEFERYAPIL